jgi:hypothetical protein
MSLASLLSAPLPVIVFASCGVRRKQARRDDNLYSPDEIHLPPKTSNSGMD